MNSLQAIDEPIPAPHAQSHRRDRPGARCWPSSNTSTRSSTPLRSRAQRRRTRDPGRARHLLRRRLLGLRVPRGRRAERARGCARDPSDATMSAGRGLRGHRPALVGCTPARARVRVRGCSSPTSTSTRCPVRSTGCRLGRPAAARRCTSAARTSSTADRRPLGDAVRDLVEERLGRRPDGIGPPARAPADVRMAVQSRWPSTTAGAPTAACSTRSCSRSRTRRGANGTGTCSTPVTDTGAHTRAKAMHVSPFLPMDVDYRVSWTVPGDDVAPATSTSCATGETMFAAELALRRRLLDRRNAVDVLVRYPADDAARLARDLPPGAGAVPRAACPCTVIRPDPLRRSPHEPAESNGASASCTDSCNTCRAARSSSSIPSDARASATSTFRRAHRSAPRCTCTTRASTSELLREGSVGLGRVVRRRLVGHRRPHRVLAARAPQPARRSVRVAIGSTGSPPRSSIRSRASGAPTPTATRATCARTTTSATSFFRHLLDETMAYSCAIFDSPDTTLAEARRAPSSTGSPACSSSRPATGCSRSAPAGAVSRSTRPSATDATSPRPPSRTAQFEFATGRVRRRRARATGSRVLDRDYRDLRGHLRQGRSRSR